jgi:hypothetical protein
LKFIENFLLIWISEIKIENPSKKMKTERMRLNKRNIMLEFGRGLRNMKAVIVTPNKANSYKAVSNGKESVGRTIGEAIDSIYGQLGADEQNTVIYVQELKGDEFFSDEQIERLSKLMKKWRLARDKGEMLPAEEQAELEKLIEIELEASGKRVQKIGRQMNK